MTGIWTLSRGELFRFAGHILEFERMDGMYARAWTRTGQLINLTGYVEVFE
jgi:hypothetical protein